MARHTDLAQVKTAENGDCSPSKITPDEIKSASKTVRSRTESSVDAITEGGVWLKISLFLDLMCQNIQCLEELQERIRR